jgi:alkylhydroperoxidase family enzyme
MINCCSILAYPHERDRKKTGQSDERILAVADRRDAPFRTDAERGALGLTEAVTRLGHRADQPNHPDSRTRR